MTRARPVLSFLTVSFTVETTLTVTAVLVAVLVLAMKAVVALIVSAAVHLPSLPAVTESTSARPEEALR